MKIRKLRASKIFCFDTIDLDFSTFKILQVIGNNLDDKKIGENDTDLYTQGNGVGKTSIYHIITEALYSKNINKIKKKYIGNIFTDQDWKIELWVDNLYLLYTVNQCILYKDNNIFIKGRKEVSEFFEEQMPFDLFTSLTYISPRIHIPYFLDTDKYKKEFLQLLFKDLYEFIKHYPTIKNVHKELTERLNTAVNVLETHKKYIPEQIPEFQPLIPVTYNTDELIAQMKAIDNQISEIEQQKWVIDEQRKQIDKIKTQLNELEAKLKNTTKPDSSIKQKLQQSKNTLIQLKTKQEMLQKTVNNRVCKLCGSIIDVSQAENDLKIVTQQIEQCNAELTELNTLVNLLNLYEQKEDLLNKLKKLETSTTSVDTTKLEELKHKKDEVLKELKIQEEKVKEINKINQERAANNSLRDKLLKEKEKSEQVIQTQQDLVNFLQEKTRRLQILSHIFSPNGIFKEKLPERLQVLNFVVNKELEFFTNQFSLEFYLENDKVIEKLLKKGKEYPIENCSTGEYTRIILALLFATKKLLKNYYNIGVDFLFIDEVFGSLDAVGRSLLLEYLQTTDYNVFLVSHSYLDYRYPILEIVKKDGISKATFVAEHFDK